MTQQKCGNGDSGCIVVLLILILLTLWSASSTPKPAAKTEPAAVEGEK